MRIRTREIVICNKINIVIILTILLLFVTIAIPSFCMLLTKDNSISIDYWDGTIATAYSSGDGSQDNPYLISNGKELAFFAQEVNNNKTYDNVYFKITDNIHLNNGVIEHKNNNIIYTKDSVKYYIKPFTNEYYKEETLETKVGLINIFPQMKTFRGNIDGNNKFIYGLYLTDEEDTEINLFESHSNGQINNLYFSNTLIYGNYSVGLIYSTQNGTYNNLIFNGNIYSTGKDKIVKQNIDDIITNGNTNDINFTTELTNLTIPELSERTKLYLTGISSSTNIYIDNVLVNQGYFEIEYDDFPTKITVNSKTVNETLSNLAFEVRYNDSISSLINKLENSRVNNSFVRGNITGKYITAPLIGYATNNLELNNSFNDATINGKYITSGLIGLMQNASTNMGSVYNAGNVNGEVTSGGIYGAITSSYNINLHDSFNTGIITGSTKGAIAGTSAVSIIDHNNYYTNENMNPVGSGNGVATYITKSNLLQENFLSTTLKFTNSTWNVSNNELPKLITFDNIAPSVTIKLLDYLWKNINTNEIKITETTWLDIEYEDLQSDILKVEYYIGDKIYTEEEIGNLEFNLYSNTINLEENGNYYIIFKTTDVVGNINITTTDLINLDGYNLIITDIYNNSLKLYNNQISYDSQVKYNFKRTYKMQSFIYPEEIKYMIKTDIALLNNTTIKLIDNITNKIYSYTVNEEDISYINNSYMYDLSLFKEIGTITDNNFDNKVINYYNNSSLIENFDLIFNFKNTDIKQNLNISIDLITLYDNTIYSSTYTNIDNSTIVAKYDDDNKEVSYNFDVSTDYIDYIDLSTISSYDISFTNKVTSSKLNETEIYNENMNSDELYLLIKIFDSNDKLVVGNLINSLEVEYNNQKYYSNNNGYIKIPFTNENIDLKLNINYIINDVINGLYYLKVNTCNSISTCSKEETIPIKVSNSTSNINCNFEVNIDDKERLIMRSNGQNLNKNNNLNIDINYDGELSNPNIRIKLYKKLNFDANNQVYELIDLKQYVSNNLELIKDYEYYLVKELEENNNKTLNLIINNFEFGGYKLVFELYDGESFVIEEYKTLVVK